MSTTRLTTILVTKLARYVLQVIFVQPAPCLACLVITLNAFSVGKRLPLLLGHVWHEEEEPLIHEGSVNALRITGCLWRLFARLARRK